MRDADGNLYESCCGTSRNGRRHYYYRVKSTGASMRKEDAEDRVRRAVARVLDENPELDETIVDIVMQAQSESESVEREAVEAMKKRLPQIDREMDNLIDLAAKTGAGRTIPEKLRALEREREVLALQIQDMESRAPLIEPDMVRVPPSSSGSAAAPIPSCAVSWTESRWTRRAACWSSSTSAPPLTCANSKMANHRKHGSPN